MELCETDGDKNGMSLLVVGVGKPNNMLCSIDYIVFLMYLVRYEWCMNRF